MEFDGKQVEEYTMGLGLANLLGFFMIVPILIIFLGSFLLFWDYQLFVQGWTVFKIYLIPILIVGVVIHELLHGVTWAIFTQKGMESIKFGFSWRFITPYCHCKEAIKVKHYALGGAMPLVILGIIPSIVALVIGNSFLLSFGILFIWAAGGDIISLFMLSQLDKNDLIFDHPDKMGFYKEIIEEMNIDKKAIQKEQE